MEKILFVENSSIIVKGMEHLLANGNLGLLELDSVATLEEMDALMGKCRYDIYLIGVRLDEEKFLLLKNFMELNPKPKVILFSDGCLSLPYERLFTSGLLGILDKQDRVEEVFFALDKVRKGEIYVCRKILERLIFSKKARSTKIPYPLLSDKENVIAEMLSTGISNSGICELLGLKQQTVSTYKRRILQKLDLKNIIELGRLLAIRSK